MIKVSKCCLFLPLRPGCVAICVIFAVVSLMGAINKLIEITAFVDSLHSRNHQIQQYQDTRMVSYVHGRVIRFLFVMLIELMTCASALVFVYGILRERLRFMLPFIVLLAMKFGYCLVHYFDAGTTHVETSDTPGALRLYAFGLINSGIFGYLWLCCYSAYLRLMTKKDLRQAMSEGVENLQPQVAV